MNEQELIEKDILAYLKRQENKGLLRFLTCGSVDDGKSTLIGRLLHDSMLIYEDQLASIKKESGKGGSAGDELDLSLLVDGLAAEREQGITKWTWLTIGRMCLRGYAKTTCRSR